MQQWLVMIATEGGRQREWRVEAATEDALIASIDAELASGESVIGYTQAPEPGSDADEWAGPL